jgi:4-hydroxy 2-oxovalerate aldolase
MLSKERLEGVQREFIMTNVSTLPKPALLDCTLRDGGYYNKWDFDPTLVDSYLQAVASAGIDYVELGLRNFSKPGFLGPFAYTTESYLNRLHLPPGPVYGVMVDAKTLLSAPMDIPAAVDTLFVDAAHSKLGLVRVAAHYHEIAQSAQIASALKGKGYIVGFNLMQSGGKPDELITDMARLIAEWGTVDALYFADSLGNMERDEVLRIVDALRRGWQGELGIHAHNNMGLAISNTMVAANAGVAWLDCTITGMGRGAGNAKTENILAILNKTCGYYQPAPVYELVIRHFEAMQRQYGWGDSLLYFLGAQNNVHPTYIQTLLSDSHYGTDEIVGAIAYLNQLETSSSYDNMILQSALSISKSDEPVSGSGELQGLFDQREVLILGSGDSIKRYRQEIEAYIRDRRPVVISINIGSEIAADFIDYYCISHNTKFLAESDLYAGINKPSILPRHRFSAAEQAQISQDIAILDYGLQVTKDTFSIGDEYCVLPFDLTAGYALSLAVAGNCAQISIVGFDGYDRGDYRQLEMIELLGQFKQVAEISPVALTPTSYPLEQGSIYAPNI